MDGHNDDRNYQVGDGDSDEPELDCHSVALIVTLTIVVSHLSEEEEDGEAEDVADVRRQDGKFGNMRVGNRLCLILTVPVPFFCVVVDFWVLDTPARLFHEGEAHVEAQG